MFRGPQAELFDEEPPLYDTIDQILRQLGAGEDSRTEFKELGYGKGGVISPRTENLSAEMVAFANAEGGMFIFGVDDSGAPAGVPRDSLDAVEQWISNVASDLCDPPIRSRAEASRRSRRRPPGGLQPRWPAERHHGAFDGLPDIHPQPASRELPVPNAKRPNRSLLPRVAG